MVTVNRLRSIGVLSSAGAIAVAVGLALPSHRAVAAGSPPVPVDLRHAAQVTPGPVDPAVAASARKYFDLALVDAAPADFTALTADSESKALAKADAYSANGTLARVSLVRATKTGTDDAASAEVGLRHINQLAWAVEFTDAREPLLGPADGGPHTKPATLVLLLDPADGSFISAAYY